MMKRGRIINILLLLFLALILFTPVGFHLKVWTNRLLSFNPTPVEERHRDVLEDYNWRLKDRNGEGFNLEEAKGQVVFINFWASWCPPCVAEMPDLRDLYQDYGKEVVFLFVARDQSAKIDAFMEKHNYQFPIYYETGLTPELLYNASLPTTFIMNKKGELVVAEVGSAAWNSDATRSLLDELLNE